MRGCTLLLLITLSASLFAQTKQHGIQVGDIDRSADPCTDFFQYANGTWRAQNPIPDYMDRWSRRWESGEKSKDQLKVILDDVSSRTDWPRGSVEQLVGDYYGSCMDEVRVNKLGITPAMPLLRDIEAMKGRDDVQRMIVRLHELGIFVPFGLVSASDNHNPSQTIANIFASGLGLPDRDYYLKTEPRFQEAREKYLLHVENMFKLASYEDANAKSAAKTVFDLEKKLAENSLDNVALRDPQQTDHKTSFPDLKKMAPAFDWDTYFLAAGISHADLNVAEPKFMQEADRQFRETSLAEWKTY